MKTGPDDAPVLSKILRPVNWFRAPTSVDRAAADLASYAANLASMAQVLEPAQYAAALRWMCDWRMYVFEQNTQRWPDGKFHLVDRGYKPWRGHDIAFTRAALTAIGCDEWDKHAIVCAHDEDFVPLEADCFHRAPRRQLPRYAELVARIAKLFTDEKQTDDL